MAGELAELFPGAGGEQTDDAVGAEVGQTTGNRLEIEELLRATAGSH